VFTAGAADGLVIQWDPADGRSLGALGVTPRMFDGMAISADGRTLLIGDPYGPIVWDVIGRKERCRITDKDLHERFVHPAVAPDGRTVTSNLSVWDAATGRRLVNLAKHGWLVATPYTADGRRVISVEQDGVHVWEITTGQELGRPIRGELVGWFNAAVSPDGRLVAAGNVEKPQTRLPGEPEPSSDPAIRVWELASGKPVARLLGHTTQSCNLAFSPDGRMLASVSGGRSFGPETWDRGLRVWEIATGRQVRRFSNYPGGAALVAYLPDGRSIVTASEDGTALVWDVSDLADRRPPEPPDAKVLEALWSDLASDEAPQGYRASWALSAEGAVPLLRDRLRPAAANEPIVGPEVLRTLRAIAALERLGSPPAREVLDGLAKGDAGAPGTRDAAEALLRLSRKKTHRRGGVTAR
jgi:WD40 repeat protein